MNRYVSSTLACALLAAWAGAQPGGGLRPEERLLVLKHNGDLYRRLVASSLNLARDGGPLDRSESYDPLIRELEAKVTEAARAGDTGRVVEMGGHLRSVLEKGLVPNLEKARKTVSANAPEEKRLFDLRDLAQRLAEAVESTIAGNPAAGSAEVRAFLAELRSARARVEKAVERPPEGAGVRVMNSER